jgi:hypothetical protein
MPDYKNKDEFVWDGFDILGKYQDSFRFKDKRILNPHGEDISDTLVLHLPIVSDDGSSTISLTDLLFLSERNAIDFIEEMGISIWENEFSPTYTTDAESLMFAQNTPHHHLILTNHGWVINKMEMTADSKTIEYIISNFEKGSTILEFGSGKGTEILSKHFKMISIEEDEDWVGEYDSEYLHAPIKDDWYDIDLVNEFLKDKTYDLVFVDGPAQGKRSKMYELLKEEKLQINKDVWFIFDDMDREDDLVGAIAISKLLNRKLQVTDFCMSYIKENDDD